ncbi:hypothetical protein ASE00_21205 [Sphingomonas sp. Root710]|nr:hypothetical protein ASE00_21205 [Sphingomonas sp. Root710]
MNGARPSGLQALLRTDVEEAVFRKRAGEQVHVKKIHATTILIQYAGDFLAIKQLPNRFLEIFHISIPYNLEHVDDLA